MGKDEQGNHKEKQQTITKIESDISRLNELITHLYNRLQHQNIHIPVKTKRQLEDIEIKIDTINIECLKKTSRYKKEIISLLEKLLRVPFYLKLVQSAGNFFNMIGKSLKHCVTAVAVFFVTIGNGIKGAVTVITHFVAVIGYGIKKSALTTGKGVKHTLGRLGTGLAHVKPKPRETVSDSSDTTVLPEQGQADIEGSSKKVEPSYTVIKEEPVGEEVPPVLSTTEFRSQSFSPTEIASGSNEQFQEYGPGADGPVPVVEADKEKKRKGFGLWLLGICSVVLILSGIIYFFPADRFSSDAPAGDEKEKKVLPLAQCSDHVSGVSTDQKKLIQVINRQLQTASFCCFANREITVREELFLDWKKQHLNLIECVIDHLPDGYVLSIIGHANKTGTEETVLIKSGGEEKLIYGNYFYSKNRAKAIGDLLSRFINQSAIVYGVGSQVPDGEILPEDPLNRRVTFSVIKKSAVLKEKSIWDELDRTLVWDKDRDESR